MCVIDITSCLPMCYIATVVYMHMCIIVIAACVIACCCLVCMTAIVVSVITDAACVVVGIIMRVVAIAE